MLIFAPQRRILARITRAIGQ